MKALSILCLFSYLFGATGYSASPIEELSIVDVPFVGERSSGIVASDSGQQVSIAYTNNSTQITIQKNGSVIGSVRMRKEISVYCVRWDDRLPWLILREKINGGSLVVAILEFKDSNTYSGFEYYSPYVKSENSSGRIFELIGVDREKLLVICSFHDSTSQKIFFKKGNLSRMKLDKINPKNILLDDSLPQDRSQVEERLPAKRVP